MSQQPELNLRQLLKASTLFRNLAPEFLDRLAERVEVLRFPAGKVVVRKGQPGDSMMIVARGRVKISSASPEGDEVILNIIEPGEVFGELALLDGGARSADATAQTPTEVLKLTRGAFGSFLTEHPEVAVPLIEVLCSRIRKTTEQVEDAMFLSLPSRLLRKIEELARRYGRQTGRGIEVRHGLSQQELGDVLGVTRESVNKQLRAWRELGLVKVKRRAIIIPELRALIAEVRGHALGEGFHRDNLPFALKHSSFAPRSTPGEADG